MKKIINVLFIAGVIAAIATGCGGTKTTSSGTSSTSSQSEQGATKQEATEQVHKLGDKVKVGALEVTAKGMKQAKQVGNQYLNKKAQGSFLLINVEVKNLDKEARMIDASMFKLVDVDGVEYDPDSEANIYANTDNKFFLENVNPKLSAKGDVVFDMPADAKGLKLKVDSGVGFAAGESVLIDLVAPAKKK